MTRHFYIILMICFFASSITYAQNIQLQSFDDPGAIGNWINSNTGSYTLSASSDAAEGSGSIALNYNLIADLDWGGSVDIQMSPEGDTYEDLTGTEGISFWYKVITPASDVTTVSWTTKLFVNSTGGTEEWHASLSGIIDDTSGEWVKAEIPFSSFAIPSWMTTHDGVLYPDQIADIQMQILAGNGITTTGEILIDNLEAYGGGTTVEGTLIESFDAIGNIGNWINSNTGSYALTSSGDAVQGEASACLDYILIADLDWGGSVDMQFTPEEEVFPDLSEDEGLKFNFKVTQPASVTDGVSLNVKLFINSSGGTEEWHYALNNVIGDTSGEWQEAKLPFANFAIPSWLTTYDGVLYADQIHTIEIQVIANAMGIETNGNICFDNLTSYGGGDVEIFEGFDLNNFDNPTAGVGSWINSTEGSYSISASDDAVEGDSSACLSYTLVGDQGWGGSVDMQFLPASGEVFTDMTGHLGIGFWYKVTAPADSASNVSFVVKVLVNSTGGTEEWHRTIGGVLGDDSGEWKQVLIPFGGLAIPNWMTTYDGILYEDQISEIQFQILGVEGTTTVGGICFDNLTSYDDEEVMVGTITPVDASVNIYPNPTSSRLYIDGLENIEAIHVFSLNGRHVKTVYNNLNTIDVSSLQSGFYVLKLQTNKGVYSARFVKQ